MGVGLSGTSTRQDGDLQSAKYEGTFVPMYCVILRCSKAWGGGPFQNTTTFETWFAKENGMNFHEDAFALSRG